MISREVSRIAYAILFLVCRNVDAGVEIGDIIAGVDERKASLQNAEVEISIVHGAPETQQITDHARVSWLGEDGKQEIVDRQVIRNHEPVVRPVNRVTTVTNKFAYVIEREKPIEEWRVSNTALASQNPLNVGVRFNRITSWKTLNTAVDGFEVRELLTRSNNVEIQEGEANSIVAEMSPPADFGGFPIEKMRIHFDRRSFAVLAFRYVYTAKIPDGSKRYVRVEQVLDGTKEWQKGVYYPTVVTQTSSNVTAPSLTADVSTVNSVTKAAILSLEVGVVKHDDFLPSTYSLPNHIVGLDTPRSGWSGWVVIIASINLAAIVIWLVFRRRHARELSQ